MSAAANISKNCTAFNFKTKHSLLDLEVEGTTMIQNVGSCEEIFPVGLLDPGDEGTAILQNYLPTDIALYPRRPESIRKKGGGWSKLCNYALYATIRQVVGRFIYADCSGCNTKTTTNTTTMRYLHIGSIEVLIGTHKVWCGPAE